MKEPDHALRVVSISHIEPTETAAAEPVPADSPPIEEPPPVVGEVAREEPHANSADQRSSGRYSFSGSADAFEPRTRTHISGRLADLGVGGCYIDTVSPLPVDTSVGLRLTSEGRVLQVAAVVTYSMPGMGMGLAFTRMSPENANLLSSWLGELSGDAPPSLDWEPEQQPAAASAADPAEAPQRLEAVRDLVELLRQKQVLNNTEAAALQKKLSS